MCTRVQRQKTAKALKIGIPRNETCQHCFPSKRTKVRVGEGCRGLFGKIPKSQKKSQNYFIQNQKSGNAHFMVKKPCLKVQILQYKFLD